MKNFIYKFTIISALSVFFIAGSLHAAPYIVDKDDQSNLNFKTVQFKKDSNFFTKKEEKPETEALTPSIVSPEKSETRLENPKGERAKLSPEERKAKREERRKAREAAPKVEAPETTAEEIAKRKAKREERKKARAANPPVQLSPEQQKKKNEEEFKNRLTEVSPERKTEICKRRQERCDKFQTSEDRKMPPMCEMVKKYCSG